MRNDEEKYSHPHYELCQTIRDISEECWCAGWLTGCEYSIWELLQDFRQNKPLHWGQEEDFWKSDYMIFLMQNLDKFQRQARGWWYWDDTVIEEFESPIFPGHMCKITYGERFISEEEWLKKYQAYLTSSKHEL